MRCDENPPEVAPKYAFGLRGLIFSDNTNESVAICAQIRHI